MVFLFILLAVVIITVIFTFAKIQIQIVNLKFYSQKQRHINPDYKIIIRVLALGKIPVFKINITKTKLEKLRLKERVKQINWEVLQDKNNFDKDLLKAIKILNLNIRKINLNIELGTENASLTSIIVPALSTVIAILLRKKIKNYEDQIFIIQPLYCNQNLINILLSGIFELKMNHIISMICVLNKKEGVKKYERTSNRRSYDYGYEQY